MPISGGRPERRPLLALIQGLSRGLNGTDTLDGRRYEIKVAANQADLLFALFI